MIRLENVNFSYEDEKQNNEVLRSVDLEIERGEFVCVVGPSGCGKTTLLRMLAGFHFPTSGTLTINGEPVAEPRDDTAIVFQDYALFPWMTAYNNIRFAIRHTRKGLTREESDRLTEQFLRDVSMEDAANKHPYQMSGGMRQRVAIARALAMDRDILLLDEPFGALDSGIRTELQNLLEKLWYGDGSSRKTVVFVTHDIAEAVRMADRIIVMDHGQVIKEISVPMRRPRTILSLEEDRELRDLRFSLTEIIMSRTSESGRACRCGGPA